MTADSLAPTPGLDALILKQSQTYGMTNIGGRVLAGLGIVAAAVATVGLLQHFGVLPNAYNIAKQSVDWAQGYVSNYNAPIPNYDPFLAAKFLPEQGFITGMPHWQHGPNLLKFGVDAVTGWGSAIAGVGLSLLGGWVSNADNRADEAGKLAAPKFNKAAYRKVEDTFFEKIKTQANAPGFKLTMQDLGRLCMLNDRHITELPEKLQTTVSKTQRDLLAHALKLDNMPDHGPKAAEEYRVERDDLSRKLKGQLDHTSYAPTSVKKSKSEGGSSYDPVPVAVGTYVALNVMEGKSPLAWDGDNAAKAVVGAAAAPFVGMAILGAGIAALGGVYLTAKGQWDSWFGKNPDLKAVPEKDVRLASAEKDIKTMYKKNPALKPSGL